MKTIFLILIFVLYSLSLSAQSLSELGLKDFTQDNIFKEIDKYESEAPKYFKKLTHKDPKVREESLKFFAEMPAVHSEFLVEALLRERNIKTRSALRKIIMSSEEKLTFKEWKQAVLAALVKEISKSDGELKYLLEVAKRNDSKEITLKLEEAIKKRNDKEPLLKAYRSSTDKQKVIFFDSIKDKLSKEEIEKVFTSKIDSLKFKAADDQLRKGNRKSLNVLVSLLTSEDTIAKKSAFLLRSVSGKYFFLPTSKDEKYRKEFQQKWKDWLAKNKDFKLKLPIKTEVMDFGKFTKSIELYSAGFNAGNSCALKYKGKSIFEKGTYSRGLNVFAIFGDEVLLKECFDTWASRDESERFHDKIKKLPDGAFVAIVVFVVFHTVNLRDTERSQIRLLLFLLLYSLALV